MLDGKDMWFCNSFSLPVSVKKRTEFTPANAKVLLRTWKLSYFGLSRFHH